MSKELITRNVPQEEREILEVLAEDPDQTKYTRQRAKGMLALIDGYGAEKAAEAADMSLNTLEKHAANFNQGGWKDIVYIHSPRGGDFRKRYANGFWAEERVTELLNGDGYTCLPYGASRGDPFVDKEKYVEYRLEGIERQISPNFEKWKRPDLLVVQEGDLAAVCDPENVPYLPELSNEECAPFVEAATAAVEVETSWWKVEARDEELSFTIKEEDRRPLETWLDHAEVPLYVAQVLYDQAYTLPYARFDPDTARTEEDRQTGKVTHFVGFSEGEKLGDIPEPEVEGEVFIGDNGRAMPFAYFQGSSIEPNRPELIDRLRNGLLE